MPEGLSSTMAVFMDCLKKINSIRTVDGQNKNTLHFCLDEANAFNLKKLVVTDKEAVCNLFHHLVNVVPVSDSTLSAKTCQLLSRMLRNQTLRHSFHTSNTANAVINWCLRILASAGELALLESLSALEMLLRGRAVAANPQDLTLLFAEKGPSSVVAWLNQDRLGTLKLLSATEMELAALKVIKAVASPTEPGFGSFSSGGNSMPPARLRRLDACAVIFIAKLSASHPVMDIHYYKRMSVCLKGMQAVALQRPSSIALDQGLGVIRAFWLVGLPEYDASCHPPTRAQPGPPPPSTPTFKSSFKTGQRKAKGGAKHVKRVRSSLSKNTAEEEGAVTEPPSGSKFSPGDEDEDSSHLWLLAALSDSDDPSDNEGCSGGGSKEKQGVFSAVRFAALRLLLLLIKSGEQQALMSFWDLLLPYSSPGSPPPAFPCLPCCLLRDPYVCSRSAAALCIAEMLHRCQPFLMLAETSNVTSLAFTSWSQTLAQALDSCQRCLTLAVGSEKVAQCLVTTLDAMASLAEVTPYHRLPPGMLTRLARSSRPMLFHKSLEVKAAAMALFSAIISSTAATHQLTELRQLLQRPQPSSLLGSLSDKPAASASDKEQEEIVSTPLDEDGELSDFEEILEEQEETTVGRTWLVEYALEALKLAERSKRFRLEPCRVLAGLAHSHFWLLLGEGGNVMVRTANLLAKTTLDEADHNIQTTSSRALVNIGQALGNHLQQPDGLESLNAALEMWDGLLSHTVSRLASASAPPLRALACDILASMGPTVYEHLPREQRLLVGFHLFSLSRDASVNVCTSAVRSLGVCVNWPAVMEDGQFVLDAAEYVSGSLCSSDEWLQSRAAWALGNLGEALVANKEKGFPESVPEALLITMLESSIGACKDEKLKAYAVRALGNLLRLLSSEQLRRSDCKDILSRAIASLIECASSPKPCLMKVRWNACHSLACVMRGKALCLENSTMWQGQVFPMLCDLVVSSPNFKVRISAAVALAAPTDRLHYASYFLPSWAALLEALASAENVQDFKEFQHRDNLVDQICLSLGHLAFCLNAEDFAGGLSGPLLQLILAHESHLSTQLQRVRLRLVPERVEPIDQAYEHLNALSSAPGVKESAIYLAKILSTDI